MSFKTTEMFIGCVSLEQELVYYLGLREGEKGELPENQARDDQRPYLRAHG